MDVTERVLIRILLTLLLIVAFCPVAVAASPNKKFDFLLRFNDLNEVAFAYHRHCLSSTSDINEKFLRTLEFVADQLYAEAQIKEPGMNSEYIKEQLLQRRYNIQYKLDHANAKEGCNSATSSVAKTHYEEFSRYTEPEVRKFIDEKTAG